MREHVVSLEPWSPALWTEMEALATAHSHEVDDGVEPRRRFKVNTSLMQAMQDHGILKAFVARRDGRMVGYFLWHAHEDVESEGLLIAMQGAWYVAPGEWGLAARLFDESVAALKAMGVKCVFPHHRTQGRGAGLGRFFRRRGAKLIQHSYCLWIGED